MDVRHLDIPDATIETAIDKGTLDAFLHGSLWDPPEDVRENVGLYVDEVCICIYWLRELCVKSLGSEEEMGC